MRSHISTIVIVILSLALLGSITLNLYHFINPIHNIQHRTYDVASSQKYPLLSKRIFIDNFSDILINFTSLRSQLRAFVKQYNIGTKMVGIYFEYLPTGSSVGTGDSDEFATASLIKVPTVMALYREVELGHITLDKLVTIEQSDLDEHSGSLYKKGVGAQLTLREAVEATLVESDNTAFKLILRHVGGDKLTDVYNALDVTRNVSDGLLTVTPKHYSSILRSLYYSSYLSLSSSYEILHTLTHTTASELIPSGVPGDVIVAHKFGIVKDVDKPENDTLSDCGIIYALNRPYLLCIMIKQYSDTEAKNIIKEISQAVYSFIASTK